MADVHVEAVVGLVALLNEILLEAAQLTRTNDIEPALTTSTVGDLSSRINQIPSLGTSNNSGNATQNSVVETAARNLFNILLATQTIDKPGFVQMWNLLDIVSILADEDQCEAALFFWLVEELLDSQTIAGCRKVFDYLESRRETITSKYFDKKQLVILRTCNELLRRLSRAEDTAFCGRVFIFLFQCFPLGDKSSVNLRGEYHVENVTTFDTLPPKVDDSMDVDKDTSNSNTAEGRSSQAASDARNSAKSVSFDAKNATSTEKQLDSDELYPIFWTLQQYFSQPKKLFEPAAFETFKSGLEATMITFEAIQRDQHSRGPSKLAEDSKRGVKRKQGSSDGDLASTFNPKYLTSRDLFDLEISDLAFRRHITVQALIVLDFMLSLSPRAKEKQATITPQNKSVMYQDQILSDADCTWVLETKRKVAEYLKRGYEGPFFHRMVETVLSRDKNWVRWKIESCPPIQRPAVSWEDYLKARAAIKKASTNKRLRPHPQASLDLTFLKDTDGDLGMERLKKPRYPAPALEDFRRLIADDEFEIEMPTNEETKERAITGKSSKSWRALRIASKTKLRVFDKIDDPEKIDIIFKEAEESEVIAESNLDNMETDGVTFPSDRRPIVVSGPGGVGKGTIVQMLIDKSPTIFAKKASHTTRPPREGEAHGVHYHFVSQEEYNVLRDGDQFLELNNFNGNDYGTSRKVVEGIIAGGKIPVMEMDYHGIEQLKAIPYPARYIFLSPPSTSELERRLRSRSTDNEERIAQRMKIAEEEMEKAKVEGFHDLVLTNDDLEKTYDQLEAWIYGRDAGAIADATNEGTTGIKEEDKVEPGVAADKDADVAMGEAEEVAAPASEATEVVS